MKRTLIRAITLSGFIGAMVGCAKNDLLATPDSSALSFSTHVSNATKGDVKTDFVIGDKFAVMATESAASWSSLDGSWYMGGLGADPTADQFVTVTNTQQTGGTTAWKYSPVKLWPEANKVSFFAFSPLPTADNGISNVVALKGSPTLDFTVSDDIAKQVDLLRSDALNKFQEEVQLSFAHALTRVTFAAKANVTATQMVRLDKISLKGIKNKGSFKIYDENRVIGSLDDMGGWSGQAGVKTYEPALSHEVVSIVPSTLVSMTAEDQTMFMIPQEFTAGAGSVLEVTYSYSNDEGKKWINNSTFEIDLAEYTQYWNAGKSYRYVLTLSPSNIYTFSAEIIDWDTELDITVKSPFSVAKLDIDPTGDKPLELIIAETRGQALGYTLKSSDASWITISDKVDGTGAKGEVIYATDGSVTTKAYDMEKKFYVVLKPNTTGADRSGKISLVRANQPDLELPIKQSGFTPFKNVPAFTQAGAYGQAYKVQKLIAVKHGTATNKLIAPTGFKLSLDGVGVGADSIIVVGNDGSTPVDFYVHTASDRIRTAKNGNISFVSVNTNGKRLNMGTYAVSQRANVEVYIGRFAGAMKTETVGSETHYYSEKLLFADAGDVSSGATWGPDPSTTGATDLLDGKGNTAKLNSATYPAAFACWNRTTSTTPVNEFYLPAVNQLTSIWIAKAALSGLAEGGYWSSTESTTSNSRSVYSTNGYTYANLKANASNVRCVREYAEPF